LKLYKFPILDSVLLEDSSKEGRSLEEGAGGGHGSKMGLSTKKLVVSHLLYSIFSLSPFNVDY